MDDPSLQRRLDDIERRQHYILALLVVPNLLGLGAFVFSGDPVGAVLGLVLVLVAVGVLVTFAGMLWFGYQGNKPSRR